MDSFGRAHADFILYGEQDKAIMHLTAPVSINPNISADRDFGNDELEGITSIHDLFNQRKLEAAAHEIDKLPNPDNDRTLNGPTRAAIYRLNGKLAIKLFDFDKAVRLFNSAFDADPKCIKARQNRVLAVELSGDSSSAFDEASNLIDDGIQTGFIASLLVRNSKAPSSLDPFKDCIAELAEQSGELNLALAQKYLEWGNLKSAESAVDRAARLEPNACHTLFWKGMVMHHAALHGNWQDRFECLRNANQSYTEALEACDRDNYRGLIPEILIHRARVYLLTGDENNAGLDFNRAVQCSPRPAVHAEAAGSLNCW